MSLCPHYEGKCLYLNKKEVVIKGHQWAQIREYNIYINIYYYIPSI